jgi:hypothetical protein
LPDGLEYTEWARDRFAITQGDPLSAEVDCEWEMKVGRGTWQTRVSTRSRMTATETHFVVSNTVEAFEGAHRVFVQNRVHEIPRDLV